MHLRQKRFQSARKARKDSQRPVNFTELSQLVDSPSRIDQRVNCVKRIRQTTARVGEFQLLGSNYA